LVFLIHTELRCTVNHTSDLDALCEQGVEFVVSLLEVRKVTIGL